MLSASLRGDIELSYAIEDPVWPVKVDAAELEFALVNIAVNARDAMPAGGRLTISARNMRLNGDPAGLDGDFVGLAVTDTGEGIAPDLVGRVFEPFFTTKPVGKGTGLGLSQVYGFAKQSGGAALITSRLGHGTTVALYLPRSREKIAAAAAEKALAARAGRGRVLVVEDNAEVRELIGDLMAQLGYEVETSETAAAALARLGAAPMPDLVFSDIVMPGPMNGYRLAHEIRQSFPAIPVLLTSGYNEIERDADCSFEVLPKPFDLASLSQAMRRALKGP
jgi:two-component system NtrC family sensor kinase